MFTRRLVCTPECLCAAWTTRGSPDLSARVCTGVRRSAGTSTSKSLSLRTDSESSAVAATSVCGPIIVREEPTEDRVHPSSPETDASVSECSKLSLESASGGLSRSATASSAVCVSSLTSLTPRSEWHSRLPSPILRPPSRRYTTACSERSSIETRRSDSIRPGSIIVACSTPPRRSSSPPGTGSRFLAEFGEPWPLSGREESTTFFFRAATLDFAFGFATPLSSATRTVVTTSDLSSSTGFSDFSSGRKNPPCTAELGASGFFSVPFGTNCAREGRASRAKSDDTTTDTSTAEPSPSNVS
mmetsp:Transcript_18274/g.49113  ORF Transcript_18274/g.49113 Transcript_18274/m.49113 type:complete len:301 (-) Transcript_18274:358-1260(-)